MGIIKKIMYRKNILGKPRHRSLFLDMEENIHIHYRDLRIELSRGEFEEISNTFIKQSQELQAIIHEKSYQDGKLANANQDDVRIWTESRLHHDVKYHPQRLSLEECTDGYHFHYRNYKLLIDPLEFREMAKLFKQLDVDSPYAGSYDEVLHLLEANDIDFILDAGNVVGSVLAISVAHYHFSKVGAIFKCINFTQEVEGNARLYKGERLSIIVKSDSQRSVMDYKRIRAIRNNIRLVDFLSSDSAGIDCNELNQINCQIMDLYSALKAGQKLNIEPDCQLWLYSQDSKQVIFPYCRAVCEGKEAAEKMYTVWRKQLEHLKLHFVKPTKVSFSSAKQKVLKEKVVEALQKDVAAFVAVDKVYMMGSATRGDMGEYLVPFVYGKWVKLGSDVDILVEIDPAREMDIPGHWQLISNNSANHCAIYHVSEIQLAEDSQKWTELFPNIAFSHHIIDAYVFFPSRGHQEEKNAFLQKFKAELFYDRARDGMVKRGGEEDKIAAQIAKLYSFSEPIVEKMNVPTENLLYKVFVGKHDYVLKLFKVSGNYNTPRITEHVEYEQKLIAQLKERGIHTAGVIPTTKMEAKAKIEGLPFMLFDRISGATQQRPEYQMDKICKALASIHLVQADRPLKLDAQFTFDEICMIWLPEFHNYIKRPELSKEVAQVFAGLESLFEPFSHGEYRGQLYARSIDVHNHGDVSPKNVIISTDDGEANFFDFNNAFFGSRLIDVLDGAFEFSLGEKYIHLADFSRFDVFVSKYSENYPLMQTELDDMQKWVELVGLIKFIKEIRVLLQRPESNLRTKRALAIGEFLLSHVGKE